MKSIAAIILAAGKGTRMKSKLVKVMHPLAGAPLIEYPLSAAREAEASQTVVVIGHQAEAVRDYFSGRGDIAFALQEQQNGTGHAVACAAPLLRGFNGNVLILCGDVPLTKAETLRDLLQRHEERQATVTVLTASLENPFGYGRIIKNSAGEVTAIVEEKDATPGQRAIREINSGIYCVAAEFLFAAVSRLGSDNAQGEQYLTDIIRMAVEQGLSCAAHPIADPLEVMGINDRVQLAAAEAVLRKRINENQMLAGVTLKDPATTYIDRGTLIGRDTVIGPGVHISGQSEIGEDCLIEPGAIIRSCRIGNRVVVKAGSVLENSIVHDAVSIGPMAHLRPGTELLDEVKIGNFVETKKVTMGKGSKASHLTYLGDASVGSDVNIGCGTITCNYDGVSKHRTVIEDGVFVGSDVQFVAPVTIGHNSLIAAGTTVTEDVPPESLAIGRCRQVNKEGWKKK
ncbi:MAG: bifunctional UDP-N-acetylglucosamine diphosphorylase/glucosamine-1-phosphate N-acetyltransferase GlmU [Deltaproteobacteria bacterium]|nr:bifunctional UDP-N-acetylglucosamine diphosphorylase/glucosamine-1-phosphate N-acetyltransferase GlmU [Deltaproteobacteria bacterium]TLN01272.1 MAG: bifunctional UDP-N-acetylglucosamine diphosphorylase/glucosamine-1-phosphate N-acetyltransferase GlmU [bacterium]